MFAKLKHVILRYFMQRMAKQHQSNSLPKQVKNIAVWQFGGVGDMLLATPVLEALHHRYPEASIHVWCSDTPFAQFLQSFTYVTSIRSFKVYDFDMRTLMKKDVREALAAIQKEMKDEDLLVNLHIPALLDWWFVEWFLITQLSTKFTMGYNPVFMQNQSLFDVSINARKRDGQHYTKLYQELMRRADIDCLVTTIFPVSDQAHENIVRLLEESNHNFGDKRWVCMHMGGRRLKVENKMWDIDSFIDLAKLLMKDQIQIVLIGVESERDLGDLLCAVLPKTINLIGRTSLSEMAALIEQANGFIGHDSGPFHIAVAKNTPAVAICGRPDPEPEYLKYEKDNVSVLTADFPDDISVDSVYESAKKVMQHE